jgi:hypothetical protein
MGFWNNIFGKGGSYFLDDEAAKGLGDTEYMKQSKAVRRTFPAGGGADSFEVTKQVSALDKEVYDSRKGMGAASTVSQTYSSTSSSGFSDSSFSSMAKSTSTEEADKLPEPSFEPSRTTNVDTGMDMFRNMAKKIGR